MWYTFRQDALIMMHSNNIADSLFFIQFALYIFIFRPAVLHAFLLAFKSGRLFFALQLVAGNGGFLHCVCAVAGVYAIAAGGEEKGTCEDVEEFFHATKLVIKQPQQFVAAIDLEF